MNIKVTQHEHMNLNEKLNLIENKIKKKLN